MPTSDSQVFNKPVLEGKKHIFMVWKTGTRESDGVRFTAFSEFVARSQFAKAFNLPLDEIRAKKLRDRP